MPYNSYNYTANHINIATSRKILKKSIFFSKKVFMLIKVLYRIGLVKNYIVLNLPRKLIKFSIFFYKNTTFYKNVRILSTSSKKFYISITALRKLVRATKSTIYLLSTPKGIIPHSDALKLNLGGILLCTIS